MAEDKFFCEHPDPNKQGTNIGAAKYHEMRRAILRLVTTEPNGTLLSELRAGLDSELDQAIFADASIGWYLMAVKLDLEARNELERVANASPQRLRRC